MFLQSIKSTFTLGGDNNINVAITDYKPNVKCDSTSTPGPNWNSCVSVFVNMKATKQVRVFGSYGDPDVEEQLPLVLEAGKKTQPTCPSLRNKATDPRGLLLDSRWRVSITHRD